MPTPPTPSTDLVERATALLGSGPSAWVPVAGGHTRAERWRWNWAVVGDARLDLAFWAPSLAQEGGPAPERLLGHEPALAAAVSGFFAARAGLPAGTLPPRVRELQRRQLQHALPWAARALGLPPLDGPSALR